ncbi:unnamed protein product [Lampetra fluviatilis]
MRGPARALPHARRTKRRRLQLAAAATATAMMMMNAAVGDTAGASAPAPPAAVPLPPGAAERDVDAESSAVLRTLLRGDGRGGRHFHDDCSAYGAHLAHLKAAAAARRAVGVENGDGGNGDGGGGGAAERRADAAFAGADDFAQRPVPSSSPHPPCTSPSDRDRSPPAHGAQPPGAFAEPGSRTYDERLHQVKRARVENIIRGISVSPGAALRDRDVAGAPRQPPQEWEVGAGDAAGGGVSSMEQDEEEASGQLSPHDGQQRENKRKQRLPQQQQVQQQQLEQAQQQQKLEERRRLKQQLEQLQKQLRHLQERFLQVYNHSSESDNEGEEDNGDVDTSDEGVSSDVCESARRFSVDTTCHAGGQLNRTRTLVPVQGVVRESDRKGPGEAGKAHVPEGGGGGGGRGWQLEDGKEFAETLKKKLTNSVSQVVDTVVHMFAPKQPAAGTGAGGGELAGPQSCAPLKTPVETSAGPGAVAANGNEPPGFLERRGLLQRLSDANTVAGARPGLPPPARAGSQRRADDDGDDDDDGDVDQTEALSLVVRKLSPERPSTVVAYHHHQHHQHQQQQHQQHQQHRGERLPSPAIHHGGHGYPGASPLHHLPPGFPLHHHHHPGLSLPILAYTLAGGLDRVGPGGAPPPPPQPPPPSFATSKLDSPPLELVEGLGRESHLGGGRLRGYHHHHQQHHHHHQQQLQQHHQQQHHHHHHQQQLLMSHGQNNAPSPALTTASGDALSLAMVKSECGEQSDSADVSPYSATTISLDLEGLTPSHLKKAKLMFFYSRYPSSNMLKIYFSDVKFNRCITSQLIKWFSNFREFYYIQVEKFARQAITEGVTNVDELRVTRDCELFRALNVHYNKANDFEVPVRFLEVSEITLREFFTAITAGKDADPSWKKAIYKVICKMDSEVPDGFRLSGCSQDSLLQ